jgi:osmoprotectant transport system permease protein
MDDAPVGPPNPWLSWTWVTHHAADLWTAFEQHVQITVVSMLLAIVVSFPLALVARRFRVTRGPILGVAGVLYTIPALALIAALVPWLGLTQWPVVLALAVYALLILLRNTVVGLDEVPADVVDAARGMGFGGGRVLWRVELPLALPAIMAGIRVATVSTIGLLTIGGYLGVGGFGNLITSGLQLTVGRAQVTTAALCCVLFAVVADLLLLGVQRLLSPWSARRPGVSV